MTRPRPCDHLLGLGEVWMPVGRKDKTEQVTQNDPKPQQFLNPRGDKGGIDLVPSLKFRITSIARVHGMYPLPVLSLKDRSAHCE